MFFREDMHICTLVWLRSFGEETPLNHPTNTHTISPCAMNFEHFVERLEYKIKKFNVGMMADHIGIMPFDHRALIMAGTCNLQPLAEGFLSKFGFACHGPYEKKKHANTKLSMWMMAVPDFIVALRKWDEKFGLNPERTLPIPDQLNKGMWKQEIPAYLDGRITPNG